MPRLGRSRPASNYFTRRRPLVSNNIITVGGLTLNLAMAGTGNNGAPTTTAGAMTLNPAMAGTAAETFTAAGGLALNMAIAGAAGEVGVFPGRPPNALGLKIELLLAGIWTDITQYTYLRNQIQITGMGRADWTSTIQACQLAITLNNRDGRFTPKNAAGAYYPNITRNVQIRVSVHAASQTGATYNGFRFWGEVSSWPPASDVSQRDLYVDITASGIWRRISQSATTIGSPYARYAGQLTGFNVPAGYWPMEDGSGSTAFVAAIGAGGNATITAGTPSFAADSTSFAGSDALMQFNNARITAPVSSAATPTDNVTRFALSVPAGGDPNAGSSSWNITETDSAGTVAKLETYLNANGTLAINGRNSGGTILFSANTTTNVQGTPVLVSAELTPSGGNVAWALRIITPGAGSVTESQTGSVTGTVGAVSAVKLNRAGVLSSTTFGQLGVLYAVPSLVTAAAAAGGFAGEFAVDRFTRLCAEMGIGATVIGSTSAAMGPQADDTLANILQSIEDTDGGLLYETRDQFGLGYRTLISVQNQSPVVLDYSAGVLGAPLTPVYDDQFLANSWAVTNTDGYVAQATLTSGAISVQPVPNGVGTYAKQAQTNAASHAQVNAIAQQRLFAGTVDDVRYPVVTVNFQRLKAAPLFASVPGLRVGDYLEVTNIPAAMGGASAGKQLAWGYSEVLAGEVPGWTIAFNTVPELPFETGFSPGVFSVGQAATQGVAIGSAVGSVVSGSQLAPGSVSSGALSGTISARSIGGMTSFISAATPYDWSFAVSGTPADATYFTCTEIQALPISAGDTFTNSGGLGGPFTVTSLDPPSGGLVNIHFTPNASGVMSTGTVFGGKSGDTWVNLSGGNQVNVWAAGAWVPIAWNAADVIQANTITAGLVAAGIVIAGIVDGTLIEGAQFVAHGSSGEVLVYSGTPAVGNLIGSWSATSGNDAAITGGGGNNYVAGLASYSGSQVATVSAGMISFTPSGGDFSDPQVFSDAAGQLYLSSGQVTSGDTTGFIQIQSTSASGAGTPQVLFHANVGMAGSFEFGGPAGSGPFIGGESFHNISLDTGMTGQLSGGAGIRVKLTPWNMVILDVEFSWTASTAQTFNCGSLPSAGYYPNVARHFNLGVIGVVSSVNPALPRVFINTSGGIQVLTPAMNSSGTWTAYCSILYPTN